MKIIFSFLLIIFTIDHLKACDCNGTQSIQEELKKSDVVFTGKVISVSPILISKHQRDYTHVLIKFSINSIIKGDSNKIVEIKTAASTGMCGYPFRKGTEYLVYATRVKENSKQILWSGLCDRTKSLSEAEEEIKELRTVKY